MRVFFVYILISRERERGGGFVSDKMMLCPSLQDHSAVIHCWWRLSGVIYMLCLSTAIWRTRGNARNGHSDGWKSGDARLIKSMSVARVLQGADVIAVSQNGISAMAECLEGQRCGWGKVDPLEQRNFQSVSRCNSAFRWEKLGTTFVMSTCNCRKSCF